MKVLNTLTPPPPNFKSRSQLAAGNNTHRRAGGYGGRRAGGGADHGDNRGRFFLADPGFDLYHRHPKRQSGMGAFSFRQYPASY